MKSYSLWLSSVAEANTAPSTVPQIMTLPFHLGPGVSALEVSSLPVLIHRTRGTPGASFSSGNQPPPACPVSRQQHPPDSHSPHGTKPPQTLFSQRINFPQDATSSKGTQPRLGRPFSSRHRTPGLDPLVIMAPNSLPVPLLLTAPIRAPCAPLAVPRRPAGGALPTAAAALAGRWRRVCGCVTAEPRAGARKGWHRCWTRCSL